MNKLICALMISIVVFVSSHVTAFEFPHGKTLVIDMNMDITYSDEAPYSKKHSKEKVRAAAEELRQYVNHDPVLKGGNIHMKENYDGDHWVITLTAHREGLNLQELLDTNGALQIFVQGHPILGSSCWYVGKHQEERPTLHCSAQQ